MMTKTPENRQALPGKGRNDPDGEGNAQSGGIQPANARDFLPAGTLVRYWKGVRGPTPSGVAKTRTDVVNLHGIPVVWVEGEAACIARTHVQPIRSEAA